MPSSGMSGPGVACCDNRPAASAAERGWQRKTDDPVRSEIAGHAAAHRAREYSSSAVHSRRQRSDRCAIGELHPPQAKAILPAQKQGRRCSLARGLRSRHKSKTKQRRSGNRTRSKGRRIRPPSRAQLGVHRESLLQDGEQHAHHKLRLAMAIGLHEYTLEVRACRVGTDEEFVGSFLGRLSLYELRGKSGLAASETVK